MLVRNGFQTDQLGLQEGHIGHGSVVTKYDPMASRPESVYNSSVHLGTTRSQTIMCQICSGLQSTEVQNFVPNRQSQNWVCLVGKLLVSLLRASICHYSRAWHQPYNANSRKCSDICHVINSLIYFY